MRLYERIEFGGQMMDLVDDCPCVMDRFHINDIFSCNVTNGNWLFYEHSNYRGRMYLIRPGEYKRFSEWGGRSARVGSIRRIMDYWTIWRIPEEHGGFWERRHSHIIARQQDFSIKGCTWSSRCYHTEGPGQRDVDMCGDILSLYFKHSDNI